MRTLWLVSTWLVATAAVARANAYDADNEISPPIAMTAITTDGACTTLRHDLDDANAPCRVIDTARVTSTAIARLVRATRTTDPQSAAYAIVIEDANERVISQQVVATPNSVTCGRYTQPIASRARLRAITSEDGQPAIALELRVTNRADLIDTGLCTAKSFYTWARTTFVVCGKRDGWTCLVADFGQWRGGSEDRCTASLSDRGWITHACESRDPVRFPSMPLR